MHFYIVPIDRALRRSRVHKGTGSAPHACWQGAARVPSLLGGSGMVADVDYSTYFKHRAVGGETYSDYQIPAYFEGRLPSERNARILDFGCGFGQLLRKLKGRGYTDLVGCDISPEALAHVASLGVSVFEGESIFASGDGTFDAIVCSHVIEHFEKGEVVALLRNLRRLLKPSGVLLVCVPNAQANTGAYWAYEDFTHFTLYTAGSILYVLRKAGFSQVDLIDVDCTAGMSGIRKGIKRLLLAWYRRRYRFWNRITGSATHAASPDVFSYEIKVMGRR